MDDCSASTFGLSPDFSVDFTLLRLVFTEPSEVWMLLLPPVKVEGFASVESDVLNWLTD